MKQGKAQGEREVMRRFIERRQHGYLSEALQEKERPEIGRE